ncbi:hypothetical protein SLEP1_g39772 [Rubroshorea leprosula]|uniref:cellulase n=1 Tax=Rubroshorea leprosula TaxID=152421 RepID=A0AAV5L1A2_9ROSI|nr:hypothetical protein SLEP1_g39772 [Rubroshorea leprosula]
MIPSPHTLALAVTELILLVHFLRHKHHHHGPSKNLTLALNQALIFFDAQKSRNYPSNSTIKFQGNSGLQDGDSSKTHADLMGIFYDSGNNNITFTFPMAFTITLLGWSVIEYHQKYSDIGNIVFTGKPYVYELGISVLVGSTRTDVDSDIKCWQRPEDMRYKRPVSVCDGAASDLAVRNFAGAVDSETESEKGIFYWNNKLTASAVNYILGDNPMKISYMVGFGPLVTIFQPKFITEVHQCIGTVNIILVLEMNGCILKTQIQIS